MIPSKELLYSVLPLMLEGRAREINFIKVENVYLHENLIHFFIYKNENERLGCSINIYELAHKCKEWAYNTTGLAVWSTVLANGSKAEVFKVASLENDFYADTEPEVIFKATQYIYDNLSNS